jgi:hypothetical protein
MNEKSKKEIVRGINDGSRGTVGLTTIELVD